MRESELHQTLTAMGDVGLGTPTWDHVDQRCRAELQREIDREHRGARVRTRIRVRRRMLVPLTVLALGALGVGGYAAITNSSTASDGINCHVDAALNGSGTIASLDGTSATATCARLWHQGDIVPDARSAPAALHACVSANGTGTINVFASNDADVCAAAGLREDQAAGIDPNSTSYARFAAPLVSQLNSPAFACATPNAVRKLVHTELQASGLVGWSITDTGGYTSQRPCASVALQSDTQTVTISPVAR